MRLNVGIFAHNEESSIQKMLADLMSQDIFMQENISIIVHILANGCTDNTVGISRKFIQSKNFQDLILIHDIAESGKSRTWNSFVHKISDKGCEYLMFMDADISLPESHSLRYLLEFLNGRPDLVACPSRPVKSLSFQEGRQLSLHERFILASSGMLDDWRHSIAGSLYVVRRAFLDNIFMPIGLPVEDGYLHAVIQTDAFRSEGQIKSRIDAPNGVYHVFESETSILNIIRHQARLVIGSSINFLVFDYIRVKNEKEKVFNFEIFVRDEMFIKKLISEKLPDKRFGFIPFHFLTKRLTKFSNDKKTRSIDQYLILSAAFAFDAIVYVYAQYLMFRGKGYGFW